MEGAGPGGAGAGPGRRGAAAGALPPPCGRAQRPDPGGAGFVLGPELGQSQAGCRTYKRDVSGGAAPGTLRGTRMSVRLTQRHTPRK